MLGVQAPHTLFSAWDAFISLVEIFTATCGFPFGDLGCWRLNPELWPSFVFMHSKRLLTTSSDFFGMFQLIGYRLVTLAALFFILRFTTQEVASSKDLPQSPWVLIAFPAIASLTTLLILTGNAFQYFPKSFSKSDARLNPVDELNYGQYWYWYRKKYFDLILFLSLFRDEWLPFSSLGHSLNIALELALAKNILNEIFIHELMPLISGSWILLKNFVILKKKNEIPKFTRGVCRVFFYRRTRNLIRNTISRINLRLCCETE